MRSVIHLHSIPIRQPYHLWIVTLQPPPGICRGRFAPVLDGARKRELPANVRQLRSVPNTGTHTPPSAESSSAGCQALPNTTVNRCRACGTNERGRGRLQPMFACRPRERSCTCPAEGQTPPRTQLAFGRTQGAEHNLLQRDVPKDTPLPTLPVPLRAYWQFSFACAEFRTFAASDAFSRTGAQPNECESTTTLQVEYDTTRVRRDGHTSEHVTPHHNTLHQRALSVCVCHGGMPHRATGSPPQPQTCP